MKNRPRLLNLVLVFFFVFGALGVVPKTAQAATSDLFFSEYIEGSSNNKALEIYNGTGAAVDLGDYKVVLFSNGSSTPGNTLTWDAGTMLADGDVYVIANASAVTAISDEADITSTVTFYNGDDAIALQKASDDSNVDVIGVIGTDPGSSWGTEPVTTVEHTLIRKATICTGDTNGTDAFDPATEWDGYAQDYFDGLGSHTANCGVTVSDPKINEFVANHTGTDTNEYIEVYGDPSTDYSAYTLLHFEGDTSKGTIDSVLPVGTTDASGFWWTDYLNNEIENGTITLLLVKDFTGADGDDLDTNDDGYFDSTPWSMIVDSVAVSDGGSGDLVYGLPVLGPGFDGVSFTPGGASRIPDGYDTESVSDWMRNDYDGDGLPLDPLPGPADAGEAINTPGVGNDANGTSPEMPPVVSMTLPVNGAAGVPLDVNIEIAFSEVVNLAEGWFEINCTLSGVHAAVVDDSANPAIQLNPTTDFAEVETCTVTVYAAYVNDADTDDGTYDYMESDYSFSFNTLQYCGAEYTPIYDIQGAGLSTPLYGVTLATEGVVVGDFQEGGKNGFFIQDPAGDADALTSDGVFVYAPSAMDVSIGDLVRVEGTVGEYYDLTQISASQVFLCDAGMSLPEPAELSLPVTSLDDFEPYEGMYVTFPQDLVISEYFNYDRYGEIVLTSTRHLTPTAFVEPGAPAIAAAADYLLDRITLDDGSSYQNPDPAIHPNGLEFTTYNRFRGGDLVTNLTGVLDYSYDLYRVQPTQGADYTAVNARTEAPAIIEGDIKVASFNVLNYFTTIDVGDDICGPILFTDVFGEYGVDPGSAWGTDDYTTNDHTLVRKADVCSGDTNGLDDFDPALEWDSYLQNYIDDLGTHTTTCSFDDLIISEYIEGSSSNKAIEIYNGTGAAVDLSGYEVVLYSNGSLEPTNTQSWAPGTMLADGETYVIANASAIQGILDVADITSTVTYFNGDDVVSLQQAGTGGMECRGADTAEEFERQKIKIVEGLYAIDADIVGLMEIENDRPTLTPDYAVADLVAGLNAKYGSEVYGYVATGAIGTDAIKVALLYKLDTVTPVGDFAILDTSVDPRFLDDYNRPALAQTFMDNMVGESITVAVNHLKSKGSSCSAIGDPDLGDGQGNCNLTRLAAAQAEVDWLASDPTGTGVDKYLIIGDLNSYDKEDPIDAIKLGSDDAPGGGDDFYDMIYEINGEDAYGYVFDGQIGYLDYALVNENLYDFVADANFWHVNADEPDIIDYDMSFKADAQDALWEPNAYRASDHDPVIITLTFNQEPMAEDDAYETDQDVMLEVFADGVLENDIELNEYDEITLDLISGPMHGTLELHQDGSFTYIPDAGFFGTDSFEYLLIAIPPNSRTEFTDSAVVTITVNPAFKYYLPLWFKP